MTKKGVVLTGRIKFATLSSGETIGGHIAGTESVIDDSEGDGDPEPRH